MEGNPSAAAAAARGVSAAGVASVRFVAAPGSGLDGVFPPRPVHTDAQGMAMSSNDYRKTFISAAADLSLSTATPSVARRHFDDEGDQGACSGGRVQASTVSASTQAPELKLSDWANLGNRRADTAFAANGCPRPKKRGSRCRAPGSAPTSSGAAGAGTRTLPLPPAWEPETLLDAGAAAAAEAAELRSRPWNKEDERALRGRIRDTMSKIEDISGGLQDAGRKGEAGILDGSGGEGGRWRGGGAGSFRAAAGRRTKSSQAGTAATQAEGEGSIKNLHESLRISLELAATGERHASANTTAMADMSEWLSNLERKQLINIRQQETIEGTSVAGVILADGLAVGDCIREYSDQTSTAYKRLAAIFKTASTETERATKELVGRLTQGAEDEGGVEGEGEAGNDSSASQEVPSAASVVKAKQAERIKRLQEQQLEEAAKTNEEAQAVIIQLKKSLQQLENRFKQVESMNTMVTTNRHKDTLRWSALALEYEMKISYLERALAQEESKLRIAEQVHREEGLELHLEMVSRQRGQARAGTKTAAMQEDLAALGAKLSSTSARLVIAENTKTKLEQELASEKEKNRKMKDQRTAQGKEALEEHETELRLQAEAHTKQMDDMAANYNQELAGLRRQVIDLREAKDEEAGRWEFEKNKLKADLEIAIQKSKVKTIDERAIATQAKLEALQEEHIKIKADLEFEKEAASEVLQSTIEGYKAKLKDTVEGKKICDARIEELQEEVKRLSARCKELVQQGELTSEERVRIEKAMREQHRLADQQKVQATETRLAGLEAEQQKLLTRVLGAEEEAARQRRAVEDLVLVLEEAKTAQLALKAAAATHEAEASMRDSVPKVRDEEAERLQKELLKANVKVESLERELTKVEQSARDAEEAKIRAREDVERAALAEKQARAAAEAAKATAVSGPTEHEEEMFQAQAILKAAVHRLEGRLRQAEEEVERLQVELADSEENADELEEEVETLMESRAKMRVEIHEAHCQVQRMIVERASVRRQGAESANLLTKVEPLLRAVSGIINPKEHEVTHSRVLEALSVMRQRTVGERAVKLSRARDRIEAENRARVEKALSAMRLGGRSSSVAGRLERAPAHLRPILSIFMSPAFKSAFLAYAQQVARGEIIMPSASALLAKHAAKTGAAISPPSPPGKGSAPNTKAAVSGGGKQAPAAAAGTGVNGGGKTPPRRAVSLGTTETVAEASAVVASAPPLARGAENRRQAMFGDLPPTKSEANLIAAGEHRSPVATSGGRKAAGGGGDGGSGFNASGRRKRGAEGGPRREGSGREQARRASKGAKWRAHRESSGFSMTLTADTAVGRTERSPSQGGATGGETAPTVRGPTVAAAADAEAVAALEANAAMIRQLDAERMDLEKREIDLLEKIRLEEDAQRERERNSNAMQEAAAKIEQPGSERDRLEDQLRVAISELEAGAARLEELSRVSEATTAAKRETEQACALAKLAEAEAAAVEGGQKGAGNNNLSEENKHRGHGKKSDAMDEETGQSERPGSGENRPVGQLHEATSEFGAQGGGTHAPPPASAAITGETDMATALKEQDRPSGGGGSAPGGPSQEAEKSPPSGSFVADSKRPAACTASSNPKRRRKSTRGGAASSSRGGNGGGGGTGSGATNSSAGRGSAATSELIPHPVFARRERAAREAEKSSKATAADVVRAAREMHALAKKASECEGRLALEGVESAAVATVVTTTDDGKPPETIEAAENAGSLTERKAEAAKKLAGASVESMLGAMELLRNLEDDETGGHRDQEITEEENEAVKEEVERNITSADMVEVSVALADALILEREGAALLKWQRRQQQQLKRRGGDRGVTGATSAEGSSATQTATVAGATSAEGGESESTSDSADISRYWSAEKAAENQRRMDILSKSLDGSDIHDLQVLRKSLQRQVDTAVAPSKSHRRSLGLRPPAANRSAGLQRAPAAGAAAAAAAAAPGATTAQDRDDATPDEDDRWRADVLRQRLGAIERAVERKGGWRAAIFLGDSGGGGGGGGEGEVNVDVDVEPWPAADAVLMLQTVKDALNVQLMESRSRVEELEDIAELVSGGDGLEGHLESAADLHRAVLLLWEGVSDVLGALAGASGRPGGTDCGDEAGPKSPATSASCEGVVASTNPAALALSDDPAARYALSAVADATDEISNDISSMLRDQELLDIPMHLEDLPVSAVTAALAVDADRVQAATKLLVPGILGALTAAAAAAATATAAGQPDGDITLQAAPPEEAPPVAPAFPVPAVPPPPRSPTPDDLGVPPQSGRQRLSTSAGSGSLLSEGGEEETPPSDERALSKEDDGGAEEDSGIQGEYQSSISTSRSTTPEGDDPMEEEMSPPQYRERVPEPDIQNVQGGGGGDDKNNAGDDEGIKAEVEEAWERAREMEETARRLREVVEERGGVIGLLQREVEDLKAALAGVETRSSAPIEPDPPAVDPVLERKLETAMAALDEEKAFLADTTQKLDISLEERERLAAEVAEAKAKEVQLETMLDEVCERERMLLAQMTELQELRASDAAALLQLDAQIEEDAGLDEPALEELRVKRRQKAKKIADTNRRLAVASSQHENMWERAMKSYKWVHHLPQISVKNRQYASVQEWIQAEIADQRKERRRLEREAHLRSKRLKSRGLLSRGHPSRSTGDLAPVLVTSSLSGSAGHYSSPARSRSVAAGFERTGGARQTAYGGSDRGGSGSLIALGSLGSQRNLNVGNLLKGAARPGGAAGGGDAADLPRHPLRGGEAAPGAQTLQAAQGRIHGNSIAGNLLSQADESLLRSPPPALRVNIPSPSVENRPSPRSAPVRGGNVSNTGYHAGGIGVGRSGGRTAPYSGPRMPNEALAAEQQRYKSLFTNAPAELPGVTVVPAGGGGGGGMPEEDASAPSKALDGGGGGGSASRSHVNRRRADAVKIDYHNSVRRRSSNTSFTHPVGHPSSLDALLQSQSRPDTLDGWGDGQAEAVAAAARGSSRSRARAGGNVSVVASAAANAADGQEEPFRWIPGANSDRAPVFLSPNGRNRNRDGITEASPGGGSRADASGAARPASSYQEEALLNRLARPRRTAATAASSSRPNGAGTGTGGWAHPPSSSPASSSSSYSELPRQLAVPGSLVDEAAVTGLSGSGVGPGAGPSRLERARREGGGGGRGGRSQARASGGVGGGAAELNNLHPAWRPKGLRRRQRAVSVVQRG